MSRKVMLKTVAALGLALMFVFTGCAPITLSSVPENAEVYYKSNDKLVGVTPTKVNLYANAKEVVIRKEGYFSKTVRLSTIGPQEIEVELKRRGKVFLLSQPSGADLFVDGVEGRVGRTPYEIDYEKPYREFEVRALGYETRKIDISDDPEGNVIAQLEREPSLILTSKPKAVDVFDTDGQKLGTTPIAIPATKKSTLELRKTGYYTREIVVGPDTESPLVTELEREPIIIVYSEPEGAIVKHRGVRLGKTPYRHLVKDDMDLEIVYDRYSTKNITIAPDSPRQVKVKLDPKTYITIHSTPSEAELYRPGGVELIGRTPLEVLVERDTAFEMHLTGYAVKPFTLSIDSQHKVTVPLVPTAATEEKVVLIDSEPSGAKVYRPGGAELIGTTPLEQSVRFERSFELQHPGYKTKIVTIASDSSDKVVFALAEDGSAGNVAISDPLLNTPSSF